MFRARIAQRRGFAPHGTAAVPDFGAAPERKLEGIRLRPICECARPTDMDFAVQLKFTRGRKKGQKISGFGMPSPGSFSIPVATARKVTPGERTGKRSAKQHPSPKLHQILRQMNGRKRFCFDFRGEHLLLSVPLGRSIRKNAAGMARLRVLKSTSIFFNPSRFRPGPIG